MTILIAIFSEIAAWTIPETQVARLRARFPPITFTNARDDEAVLRAIADADVAFLSELRQPALAAATRLRWIHSPAAGVGNMLFPDMVARDIVVTNSRGLHAVPIAEHVLGVTIALARKIHTAVRRQVSHDWAQNELCGGRPPWTLRGKRMGVVGLGAVGSAVAELAAAAGMLVAAVRRRVELPRPECVTEVYGPAQLPELLSASDVVVLAAPLTVETRGLIGARELTLMKPDAVLVNVARGKLVNEGELGRALGQGIIGGAALDVFEHEPLDPGSPLWDLPNVIITPHTSGVRGDIWEAAVDLFSANLRRFERGEPLLNVVDKRAGY